MKRTQLLFPLVFLLALGASAFTLQAKSTTSDPSFGYYYNPNWNTCDVIPLNDGKCMSDNLGYICMEFIPGVGYQYIFEGTLGTDCYQPYYSYVP